MGRRSDASVEAVGLSTCPDPDGANLSRSLHRISSRSALLVADGNGPCVPVRWRASSHAAGILPVAARSAYETAMRPQTPEEGRPGKGMTLDALES
jgi:hypothetical protein